MSDQGQDKFDDLDQLIAGFFQFKHSFTEREDENRRLETRVKWAEMQETLVRDSETALRQELSAAQQLVVQLQGTLNGLAFLQSDNQRLKEEMHRAQESYQAQVAKLELEKQDVSLTCKRGLENARNRAEADVEKMREELKSVRLEAMRKEDEFGVFCMTKEQESELLLEEHKQRIRVLEAQLTQAKAEVVQAQSMQEEAVRANLIAAEQYSKKLDEANTRWENENHSLRAVISKKDEQLQKSAAMQRMLQSQLADSRLVSTQLTQSTQSVKGRRPLTVITTNGTKAKSSEQSPKPKAPRKSQLYVPSKDLSDIPACDPSQLATNGTKAANTPQPPKPPAPRKRKLYVPTKDLLDVPADDP